MNTSAFDAHNLASRIGHKYQKELRNVQEQTEDGKEIFN